MLTAMSGFTTQNCRVACRKGKARVRTSSETEDHAPSLARWACAARQGTGGQPSVLPQGDCCLEEEAGYVGR